MKRRVLSMLMVLVMMASVLSVSAFATEETALVDEAVVEVVDEAAEVVAEEVAEVEAVVEAETEAVVEAEEAQEEAPAVEEETPVVADHKHYDYSGDYLCDRWDCEETVPVTQLTSLTITDLTMPSEGAAIDFNVSIAEDLFGTGNVKWKRMTKTNGSDAVVMSSGKTYSAGCMYDLEIWVPYNYNDPISENINITLNGQTVPFYTTANAYNNARNTFEGINPVYRAHFYWENGARCIVVSVLFPKLAGTHTCTYDWAWITNSAKHFHKCNGCDAIKDAEAHYDKDKSGLCDVCNFEMKSVGPVSGTGTGTHTHTYGSDWVEDNANHWKQCTTCGAKSQNAAHADLNDTGKCDVCGFVMKTEAGHTHSYSTDWVETFAQHYKECSCGAKTEIAAHFDNNKSGLCDVCGYAVSSTSASNGGTLSTVPNTGDSNATFLWIAAMIVSMMGLCGVAVVAKKQREE